MAVVGDTFDGFKKIYEVHPDLVIIAKDLPRANAEDPCVRIRQMTYLPIIVLGDQCNSSEILERGADAYMEKPPDLTELKSRVRSLLRRKRRSNSKGGSAGSEEIETRKKDGDTSKGLTPTEFRLASCLILNKHRLLNYLRITSEVWGGKKVTIDTLHFY